MLTAPYPHTGIFREENAVLRYLLGYGGLGDHPLPSILQSYSALRGTAPRDVILVAADIDTRQGFEHIPDYPECHIGVSTLDCRDLLSLPQHEDVIKSYQFTVGETRYCRKAAKRFLFGENEKIHINDFSERFSSLIGERKYVLVVHGGDGDCKFLENFGIISKATYVLDTVKVAQFILQLYYRYSQAKLLEALGIPFGDLFPAGNDAHYTLRALLALAAKDSEAEGVFSASEASLRQSLQTIAYAPQPEKKNKALQVVYQEDGPRSKETSLSVKRRQRRERRAARKAATGEAEVSEAEASETESE